LHLVTAASNVAAALSWWQTPVVVLQVKLGELGGRHGEMAGVVGGVQGSTLRGSLQMKRTLALQGMARQESLLFAFFE
jgi:hypothetical protein